MRVDFGGWPIQPSLKLMTRGTSSAFTRGGFGGTRFGAGGEPLAGTHGGHGDQLERDAAADEPDPCDEPCPQGQDREHGNSYLGHHGLFPASVAAKR